MFYLRFEAAISKFKTRKDIFRRKDQYFRRQKVAWALEAGHRPISVWPAICLKMVMTEEGMKLDAVRTGKEHPSIKTACSLVLILFV